ncbi:MAG: hypothetical protein JXA89_13515 [Anaerolineae bacterium]|nr:hypothetical protein [Anaerolineae bacterium]
MSEKVRSETISVGVARADITPPVGIKSAGFAARGPLTRLHDPLFATALVFDDGHRQAALISCDLLHIDAQTVGEVRSHIERSTDIAGDAVTVACTHTHYGPDPYRDLDDPLVKAYRSNLIYILSGVVSEAALHLQPARFGVSWGESHIGINRREKLPDGRVILGQNPGGAIDRAVGVLRIDSVGGTPLACVVNFQTHPVSQGGSVDHISADYPGKMREVVEGLTGAQSLFLQGAAGNINAVIMEPCYESARTLGVRLGCEVVRVWETIVPQAASGIEVQRGSVDLPRTRYGSRENAAALVASLEQEIRELESQDGSKGRLHWANTRLKRAQDALASWTGGVLPEPIRAELQAWRIGTLGIVTTPGEIFTQIGVRVKETSPFADTFFLGHSNDSIGYVPIPEAYPDGGYEVTHASQVAPEAAGTLAEGCLQLLNALE